MNSADRLRFLMDVADEIIAQATLRQRYEDALVSIVNRVPGVADELREIAREALKGEPR